MDPVRAGSRGAASAPDPSRDYCARHYRKDFPAKGARRESFPRQNRDGSARLERSRSRGSPFASRFFRRCNTRAEYRRGLPRKRRRGQSRRQGVLGASYFLLDPAERGNYAFAQLGPFQREVNIGFDESHLVAGVEALALELVGEELALFRERKQGVR